VSFSLEDLESLRSHIRSLPEAEREDAIASYVEAITLKLTLDAIREDGVFRKIMPAIPCDPGDVIGADDEAMYKFLDMEDADTVPFSPRQAEDGPSKET
jgi:hypothetical protein